MLDPRTINLAPLRPPMPDGPGGSEEKRSQHQWARYRILTEQHDDIADEWRDQHIDADAGDAWGPSDLSVNPLAEICRQLSTPGLYSTEPVVSHEDQAAQALIGRAGALADIGYWTKMQRVQYLTLGIGEMLPRFDVHRGKLIARLVYPHNVFVLADPANPMEPVVLWELRPRWWRDQDRWLWTWDMLDLGDEALGRPPSYRIADAQAVWESKPLEDADLSNVFLRHADGESTGALVGEAFPYRLDGGTGDPMLPYPVYRSADTGQFWNHLDRRGVHHGTLNAILYYTYAGHCARAATGSTVFIFGAEPSGGVERNEAEGNNSGYRKQVYLPGTVEYMNPNGTMPQPLVHEIGPGVHLPDVANWAREYAMQQAVRWGLNPSDVSKQHANPTSGAALAISNSQKREAQRQFEPIFRRADLKALQIAASLMGAAGLRRVPETGYTISYAQIKDSPEEERDKRDDIQWRVDNGYLSPLDAYMELVPGANRDVALRKMAQARRDRIELAQATAELLREAGLTPAPPNTTSNTPTEPQD